MSDTAPTAEDMIKYGMYIDGKEVPGASGKTMESDDPYKRKPWAIVPDGSNDDIDAAVAAARKAFDTGPWGSMTATERARLLRKLGDIIARDAEELAQCECRDNGKLYREMLGQWQYLPEWFYYGR